MIQLNYELTTVKRKLVDSEMKLDQAQSLLKVGASGMSELAAEYQMLIATSSRQEDMYAALLQEHDARVEELKDIKKNIRE